jgi:hypothetical protein
MFGLDKLIGEKLEKLEGEMAKSGGGLTKISRRDLFAVAAMQAILSRSDVSVSDPSPVGWSNARLSKMCVGFADAMLDELAMNPYNPQPK